jgi:hypothetical protein
MAGVFFGTYLGVVISIIGILGIFAFRPEANLLTIFQAAGSVATGASAIIAFHLYRSSIRKQAEDKKKEVSREFLDESIKLLNRAYEVFTSPGDRFPPNDRVVWLTTARMIVRYEALKSRITEPEHLDIAEEHEEYGRHRFYTILQDNREAFTAEYLAPSGDVYDADVVPRQAIAVIFDFAKWKDGMTDPLDSIDDKKLFASGAVPPNFFCVIDFLERYESYWSEVVRIRESRRPGHR